MQDNLGIGVRETFPCWIGNPGLGIPDETFGKLESTERWNLESSTRDLYPIFSIIYEPQVNLSMKRLKSEFSIIKLRNKLTIKKRETTINSIHKQYQMAKTKHSCQWCLLRHFFSSFRISFRTLNSFDLH